MANDRDLNRTSEKIISAACREFSRKGFAGARTDAIARSAGVNERMIFYCFESKEGIYREVLKRKLKEIMRLVESDPDDDFAAGLVNGFEMCAGDVDFLRMAQWEALEGGKQRSVASEERQILLRTAAAKLRRLKLSGALPPDADEHMLLLIGIGLKTIPLLLPQLTRLISGLAPDDPRFRRKWAKCLRWVGGRIGSKAVVAADQIAEGWIES
jgi:TetR/AcrR family transcriptional regulator